MTTVTTLVGSLLYNSRRCGNSRRQCNFAIDELFNGNKVLVRDHYNNGLDRKANNTLAVQIIKTILPLLNEDQEIIHNIKDQSLILR